MLTGRVGSGQPGLVRPMMNDPACEWPWQFPVSMPERSSILLPASFWLLSQVGETRVLGFGKGVLQELYFVFFCRLAPPSLRMGV